MFIILNPIFKLLFGAGILTVLGWTIAILLAIIGIAIELIKK